MPLSQSSATVDHLQILQPQRVLVLWFSNDAMHFKLCQPQDPKWNTGTLAPNLRKENSVLLLVIMNLPSLVLEWDPTQESLSLNFLFVIVLF